MYRTLFHSVFQGATVLTGSNRLARGLTESYTAYQRDKGRSVWTSPAILSLDAFLNRCWRDWTMRAPAATPLLLNATQEAALWESVIWDSPAGRTLLRVPETAQNAMDAWRLIQAYRVPFDESAFSISDDCEAFFGWATEFQAKRDAGAWLESARLSDTVADLIRDNKVERPFPIILAGFDDLTPQQRELLDALCGAQDFRLPGVSGTPATLACRDNLDEIKSAALWARTQLEKNRSARVGVVVPNLESVRGKVDRLFGETLDTAFHISLGAPLSQHAIVHAALLLLELAQGPIAIERVGILLRSPYTKGAQEEQSQRARLDARLLRAGSPVIAIQDIRSLAGDCPGLYRSLGALEREMRKQPTEQQPSLWSYTFSRLLKLAGWPGTRALDSQEYQIMNAWNGLFSALASLDTVTGRITFDGALHRLRSLAANTRFQSENLGAPVQVLGLLEASGQRFDQLWVMGLHDQAMPPPARPHPFLPIGLQRQYGLPHASAERELDFNSKLMERLAGLAPEVVFSYPEWEGDQELSPSPLLPEGPAGSLGKSFQTWTERIRAAAALESYQDSRAPELPAGFEQRGGTHTIKDMSACPFRAFAQHRLSARPLEETTLGMNPRARGSAVHKALELIWLELKTHQALVGKSAAELQELVSRCVAEALRESPLLGRSLEQWRQERLLLEWLEMEKGRPPFTVLESEKEHGAEVGGLRILTRIDRVDELPGGERVILDYKTGLVKTAAWQGDRPDEPQVPLYCSATEQKIGAAAFAQLRKGKLEFVGVAENTALGKMREMKMERGARIPELVDEWTRVLGRLGEDFRRGVADVDPKNPGSCDYCAITAFCRVKERHD